MKAETKRYLKCLFDLHTIEDASNNWTDLPPKRVYVCKHCDRAFMIGLKEYMKLKRDFNESRT